MSTPRFIVLLLLVAAFAPALCAQPANDTVVTDERTVTQVADGVYVIRHPDAPDTFPQGNTTVVVGTTGVLVVDACYLPSSAREDIAQIRTWTDLPVRYLVNTHWHYDHTMGNGVYAEAFPGLTVIAHTETRRQMAGYNPGWFERFPARADLFRQVLERGVTSRGDTLSEDDRKAYEQAVAGVAPVQEEFATLVDRLPDVTFDRSMTVDLGGREVHLMHLGRGNTAGDAVVYLPAEGIVVAGDLLDHPVPYLGGGFPTELVETLRALARLEAGTIVPGHGNVLEGDYARAYLRQVTDFVAAVVAEVGRQVHRRGNNARILDEIQAAVAEAVDVAAWRRRFAGDDADSGDFFESFSFPGVVAAAYAETWRK